MSGWLASGQTQSFQCENWMVGLQQPSMRLLYWVCFCGFDFHCSSSEHLTQDMFHLEIGTFKLKNSGIHVKKDTKFFQKYTVVIRRRGRRGGKGRGYLLEP